MLVVLLTLAASAADVCHVPVPAGFVVEVEVDFDSWANEQWVRLSNTEDLSQFTEFTESAGPQSGQVWSEGGIWVASAVDGVLNDCRVDVHASEGYAVVEFEDGDWPDYDDVTIKLTPHNEACFLKVPVGWEMELSIEYNSGGWYDQLVQVASGRWDVGDLATFHSDDGPQTTTATSEGGVYIRGANFPFFGLPGDPEPSECQVSIISDSEVQVGFEGSTNDDFDDTVLTISRVVVDPT